MPKVHHVKKSRKEFPGIPKGSEYYWWQFPFHPVTRSLKPPRLWQLTQSEFKSQYLRIADETIESLSSWDDAESMRDELENLRDETQDKIDNMPADSGEVIDLLESRVNGLDEWIAIIDDIISDNDGKTFREEAREDIRDADPCLD
jgi:hypothetical protein